MLMVMRSGRQRFAVAGVLIIFVIIGVTVVLLNIGKRSSSNLRWNVQVGDNFVYAVETSYSYSDSDFNTSIFNHLTALNHTRIRMQITSLPSIPPMIDGDIFLAEVINPVKVYCTFDNGSELDPDSRDGLIQMLSSCLLPVGDWDLLDWCFVDDVSNAYYPGIYVSELQTDHFRIGYELWPGDAIVSWSANVTLENGVPLEIFSENNSFSVGTYSSFQLTIRL
jgi:hypothetical protein